MADPSTFTAVDLSRLPAPAVIEALSFETIRADMIARLKLVLPGFDATVESDPAVKVLEVAAYREVIIRQRVNDASRAVMVAYATGADLDQLAALFGVGRLLVTPAVPATGAAAVYESDTDLRRRIVLAPEGYSVAGPEGAYIFHALSAAGDVLDASATSPSPGTVVVAILSRSNGGAASPALVATVKAYLSDDTRRPLTDNLIVQPAAIVDYAIAATLHTFAGPDASIVLAASRARLDAYVAESHRLGRDVTRSGIFAALHSEGVQNVALSQPAADIVIGRTQAARCTGIAIDFAGIDE